MKINQKHSRMVKYIAKEYQDVFQQYNSDVDTLIARGVKVLSDARGKQRLADEKVDAIQSSIEQRERMIEEAEREIEKHRANEKDEKARLIEEKKQNMIDRTFVHSDIDVAVLKDKYDTALQLSQTASTEVSIEDLKAKFSVLAENDRNKADILNDMVNRIGVSYGICRRKDGKWTLEFSRIFNRLMESSQSGKLDLMQYSEQDIDGQYLIEEYKDKYKLNPYIFLRYLLCLLYFPYVIFRKAAAVSGRYSGASGVVIEYFAWIFVCVKTGTLADKLSSVGSIILYFILLSLLLHSNPILIGIYVLLAAGLTGCYVWAKRNSAGYVNHTICRFLYFKSILGGEEEKARAEWERLSNERRSEYAEQARQYGITYNNWIQENREVKMQAERDFDAGSVDMRDIERQYNNEIAKLRQDIASYQKEQLTFSKELEECIREQKRTAGEYDEAKKEVGIMLSNKGISRKVTNGIGNDRLGIPEERVFSYFVAYANVYSLLNGFYMKNILGGPVNGNNIGKFVADDKVDFEDLPVKTIPARMYRVNVEKWAYENENMVGGGVEAEAVYDFNEIMEKAGSSFEGMLKKAGSLNEYKDAINIDSFDTSAFYKIELEEYNSKCAVIEFDSQRDPDYVQTVSRFIYERLFKPTYMLENPVLFRHHFVVNDQTYFNKGNVVTLAKSAGEDESVIRQMQSLGMYDIVTLDGYQNLLKTMIERRIPEFTDAMASANAGSQEKIENNIEYLIATRAKGSHPHIFDYMYIWLKPADIRNSNIITILQGTGGSKASGVQASSENTYGIIPFIFFDRAELNRDKPDEGQLKAMLDIGNAVCFDNFFTLAPGAGKVDRRNRVDFLNEVQGALQRAR